MQPYRLVEYAPRTLALGAVAFLPMQLAWLRQRAYLSEWLQRVQGRVAAVGPSLPYAAEQGWLPGDLCPGLHRSAAHWYPVPMLPCLPLAWCSLAGVAGGGFPADGCRFHQRRVHALLSGGQAVAYARI